MKFDLPDIDIDFANRNDALLELVHIPASVIKNGEITKHNTGVYFQDIPVDPITNLASIDYATAEELGYFKIDFLNLHIYQNVRDNEHLDKLCSTEPLWSLLEDKNVVDSLFHLSGNFDIVSKFMPTDIEQLAVVMAIKIPCKRYLIGRSWNEITDKIWLPEKPGDFFFKKSHAYCYAQVVMVQMNLLVESVCALSESQN